MENRWLLAISSIKINKMIVFGVKQFQSVGECEKWKQMRWLEGF